MVSRSGDNDNSKFLESCIVSVYQAAFKPEPPPNDLPTQFRARPLLEAVDGIIELGSFTDQKQVLALIVSAGLASKHRDGKEAILRLGRRLMPNQPGEIERLQALEAVTANAFTTQELVQQIVDRSNISGGACAGRDLCFWASTDPHTLITTAQATIMVDDDPFDLAKVLGLNHPFRWMVNWHDYFISSTPTLGDYDYMTGVANTLKDIAEPLQRNDPHLALDDLKLAWNWDIPSMTNPRQLIYEELVFPAYLQEPAPALSLANTPNNYSAIFRNILKVKWSGSLSSQLPVTMDYNLQDSTFCQLLFGSLRNGPNGLLTDGGYMKSERTPTGWKWISVKHIKFDDLTPGRPQTPGVPDFGEAMNEIAPTLLARFIVSGLQQSCC